MAYRELTTQLVVERYKFIQDKIKFLDNMMHIHIGMTIKFFVGIFSFFYGVVLIHIKQPELISHEAVIISIKFASSLIFFTSVLFFLMTVSNILSWLGYRRDEVALLQKFGGAFKRECPNAKNFLTWQESWYLISLAFIIICSILTFSFSREIVSSLLSL